MKIEKLKVGHNRLSPSDLVSIIENREKINEIIDFINKQEDIKAIDLKRKKREEENNSGIKLRFGTKN